MLANNIPQDELDIVQRFKEDTNYRENETQMRKEYITKVQIAKFSKKALSFQNVFIDGGKTVFNMKGLSPDGYHVFFISGTNQPTQQLDFASFMSSVCVFLDQVINSKQYFVLVYFNTGLLTHSNLSRFFQEYKNLPVEYFTRLKQLYILHGNFFIKSWFWFQNVIQIKTLKQKVTYVASLSQFTALNTFTLEQFNNLPQYVINNDSSSQTLKQSLEAKWKKDPKDSINQVLDKQICGLNLSEYEINEHGIPVCIEALVSYLYRNKHVLCKEGIFRKSAAQSKEKALEELLIRQKYEFIDEFDDDYAIAGLLRKIYDKMPTPLIPYKNYPLIIQEIKSNSNMIPYFREKLLALPEISYRNLVFILGFLQRVSLNQDQNKMTTYNLSVVFAPCFLRPHTYTFEDINNAASIVKALQIILENYQEIFPGEKYERYLNKTSILNKSNSLDNITKLSIKKVI